MKFNCSTESLRSALEIIGKSVDTNPTHPILNNFLLELAGRRLTLSATNLESTIKHSIEVEVINEGSITIPARIFSNYVGFLNEEKVEVSVINDEVEIKSGKSKTKIKGLPASEFPILPKIEKALSFKLPAKALEKAIRKTTFVCTVNNTRPVLSGVYFKSNENELNIVSTDGYRLSEKIIPLASKVENFEVIIPVRTLNEISKALTKVEEAEMIIGENQVMFKAGDTELFSRIIEGKFPDYQVIIPTEVNTTATVKTAQLLSALRQMGAISNDNNKSIKIKSTINSLQVLASVSQVGEGQVELPAVIDGEEIVINLNAEFMIVALNNFEAEEIKIQFKNNTSPVIFRPVSEEQYLHLIMPLKS